jgi:hypothetical protein
MKEENEKESLSLCSRTGVINTLNNAIVNAENMISVYDTVWEQYNKMMITKGNIGQPLDSYNVRTVENKDEKLDPPLKNSPQRITKVYTIIDRLGKSDTWASHGHAFLYIGVIDQYGDMVYYSFNHAVLFIQIQKRYYPPVNNYNTKVTCEVDLPTNRTLGDVIRIALLHWYNVNALTQREQWPTSCTGFTDMLLYYIYGERILNLCPLTKLRVFPKGHTLYSTPMKEVKAYVTTYVDSNGNVSSHDWGPNIVDIKQELITRNKNVFIYKNADSAKYWVKKFEIKLKNYEKLLKKLDPLISLDHKKMDKININIQKTLASLKEAIYEYDDYIKDSNSQLSTVRSPSPTRSPTRSPIRSRSPSPTRTRSRSRSPSPTRSRSPSLSRSRSRSPDSYFNQINFSFKKRGSAQRGAHPNEKKTSTRGKRSTKLSRKPSKITSRRSAERVLRKRSSPQRSSKRRANRILRKRSSPQRSKKRRADRVLRKRSSPQRSRKRRADRVLRKRSSPQRSSKRRANRVLRKRSSPQRSSKRRANRVLRKRSSPQRSRKRGADRVLRKRSSPQRSRKRRAERMLRKRSSPRRSRKRSAERVLRKRSSPQRSRKRRAERVLRKRSSPQRSRKRRAERMLRKRSSPRRSRKRSAY